MLLLLLDLLEISKALTSLQSPPSFNTTCRILQLRNQERTTQHPVRVFKIHIAIPSGCFRPDEIKHFLLRKRIVFEAKKGDDSIAAWRISSIPAPFSHGKHTTTILIFPGSDARHHSGKNF